MTITKDEPTVGHKNQNSAATRSSCITPSDNLSKESAEILSGVRRLRVLSNRGELPKR